MALRVNFRYKSASLVKRKCVFLGKENKNVEPHESVRFGFDGSYLLSNGRTCCWWNF
jgi:hypothetical protein